MPTTAPTHAVPATRALLPAMRATIARRLLVNYRVDPDRAAALLPLGLTPQLAKGHAVAGICLIRLTHLRPAGLPTRRGLTSENAAHRIAVRWEAPTGTCSGVYIPRRHSNSMLTTALGGRVYPGHHQRADFTTEEHTGGSGDEPAQTISVAFTSRDQTTSADVTVRTSAHLSGSHLFPDTRAASDFFSGGSCGYSPARRGGHLEGMRLETDAWSIEACELLEARSSLFDDAQAFPHGTASLDSALLMQHVPVTWRAVGALAARPPRLALHAS